MIEAVREMTFEEEYKILQEEIQMVFAMENGDEEPLVNCVLRRALRCIRKLKEQPQADKWIPCSERLPSEEMSAWVTHENGKVLEHYWYQGRFVNNYPLDEPRPYPEAIAWMPIIKPQPYKKEGESNADS